LPRNRDSITLEKSIWQVPNDYKNGDTAITPLKAGEQLTWKLQKPQS
jgi:dihydroorotase